MRALQKRRERREQPVSTLLRVLQVGVERSGDVLANQVADGVEEGQHRQSLARPSFSERYVHGHGEIHVHGRVQVGGNEAHDFCAVFHRSEPGASHTADAETADIERGDEAADDHERWCSMLVKVVEVLQDGEVLRVPSLARLRILQDCPYAGRYLFGASEATSQLAFELLGTAGNREVDARLVRWRIPAADGNGEAVSDVVKGLPEVVEAIRRQRSELSRNLIPNAEGQDVLAGLNVAVKGGFARATFEEALARRVQGAQVIECPI